MSVANPVFGEWLRNIHASPTNPQRDGRYIETITRPPGRTNAGTFYNLTDGKGSQWQCPADALERIGDEQRSAGVNYDVVNIETALGRIKTLGPEHKDARVFMLKPQAPDTLATVVIVSPGAKGERLTLIEEQGEQCFALADTLPGGGCVACALMPVPIIDAIAALREANPEAHKALRDAVRSLAKPLEWASEEVQK